MRIRKIQEKDICAAALLMSRSGLITGCDMLTKRLHQFQYKRSHLVVVAEQRGKLISLMHIGIEPSLTQDREAFIYSMFIDQDDLNSGIAETMVAYGEQWAKRHGCERIRNGRDIGKSV